MNNNRRNKNRQTRQDDLVKLESQEVNLLKDILALQRTQQTTSVPRVPDPLPLVLKRDKVYSFSRVVGFPTIQYVNTGYGAAYTVSLSAFPAASDIVGLFEQYRIIQLTFRFMPVFGQNTPGASNLSTVPLYSWIDQDDANVPSGTQDAYQRGTLMIAPAGQYHERTLVPQLAQDGLATGSVTTGYSAPSSNMWVDNESSSAAYYGLKAYLPPTGGTTGVNAWSVTCEAIIQCRRFQ